MAAVPIVVAYGAASDCLHTVISASDASIWDALFHISPTRALFGMFLENIFKILEYGMV